jgi:hypothetical protein
VSWPRSRAALIYAARGWPVFPLRGKVPWIAGGNGCLDATTGAEQIRTWWRDISTANVGIATGRVSGLFIVDVDLRHDGDVTMRELIAKNGPLPITTTVKTGGGGWHFYFSMPANVPITIGTSQIGAGIDHKGDGGYVAAPPSVHPDTGRTYSFIAGRLFKDVGIVAAPAWLYEAARKREPDITPIGTAGSTTVLTEYGEAALRSAAANIIGAPNGRQEKTLNDEAYGIGRAVGAGLIPADVALRVLLIAARKIQDYNPRKPWWKGEPGKPGEAEAKVYAAFKSGVAKPRPTTAELDREFDRVMREAGHG